MVQAKSLDRDRSRGVRYQSQKNHAEHQFPFVCLQSVVRKNNRWITDRLRLGTIGPFSGMLKLTLDVPHCSKLLVYSTPIRIISAPALSGVHRALFYARF